MGISSKKKNCKKKRRKNAFGCISAVIGSVAIHRKWRNSRALQILKTVSSPEKEMEPVRWSLLGVPVVQTQTWSRRQVAQRSIWRKKGATKGFCQLKRYSGSWTIIIHPVIFILSPPSTVWASILALLRDFCLATMLFQHQVAPMGSTVAQTIWVKRQHKMAALQKPPRALEWVA